MAFDFPNTPSVGDLFQDSSSGAVYRWNGYAWVGGVTGIGLQTVKETRYLVAGSFTHTRDPKNSSGLGDIYLLGPCGGRLAQTWASGQTVIAGGGGGGAITIKFKYAMPASAPVIVGASSGTAIGGPSSFDTVLTALGASPGGPSTAANASNNVANGGTGGVAGTTGDENYSGVRGPMAASLQGVGFVPQEVACYLRGIIRKGAASIASGSATIAAILGDPGAVFVVEYLNP